MLETVHVDIWSSSCRPPLCITVLYVKLKFVHIFFILCSDKSAAEQNHHFSVMVCVFQPICTCVHCAKSKLDQQPSMVDCSMLAFHNKNMQLGSRHKQLVSSRTDTYLQSALPFFLHKNQRQTEKEYWCGRKWAGWRKKREGPWKKLRDHLCRCFQCVEGKQAAARCLWREGREKAAPVVGWWSGHGWHQSL